MAVSTVTTNSVPPTSPADGDLWIDESVVPYAIRKWVNSTTKWQTLGYVGASFQTAEADPTDPTPVAGDTYFNITTGEGWGFFIYDGTSWLPLS